MPSWGSGQQRSVLFSLDRRMVLLVEASTRVHLYRIEPKVDVDNTSPSHSTLGLTKALTCTELYTYPGFWGYFRRSTIVSVSIYCVNLLWFARDWFGTSW